MYYKCDSKFSKQDMQQFAQVKIFSGHVNNSRLGDVHFAIISMSVTLITECEAACYVKSTR